MILFRFITLFGFKTEVSILKWQLEDNSVLSLSRLLRKCAAWMSGQIFHGRFAVKVAFTSVWMMQSTPTSCKQIRFIQ